MSETTMTEMNPEAPHGYGPDGKPLAPFGYKADGTPKKDGRGRALGAKVAAGPRRRPAPKKKAPAKRSQSETREMLVGLADMLTVPLAGAAASPVVRKRIGDRQSAALSGDAVILQNFAPHFADGLIAAAQTKPGLLSWMDTVEEKAPYFMLAQVGLQMTKALISNHLQPDERLANAGQTLVAMRSAQMAEAIEREAAAMGVVSPAAAAA